MSKSNRTTKTVKITTFYVGNDVELYERFDAPPCVQAIQERGDYVVVGFGDNGSAAVDGRSYRALNAGVDMGDRVNLRKQGSEWVMVSKV